jgi:hypothetical protein
MRGSDWLLDWVDEHKKIFVQHTSEELQMIRELMDNNEGWIDATGTRPAADPFVIACAHHRKLVIIQQELPHRMLSNIARKMKIDCVRLPELFVREKWVFK